MAKARLRRTQVFFNLRFVGILVLTEVLVLDYLRVPADRTSHCGDNRLKKLPTRLSRCGAPFLD